MSIEFPLDLIGRDILGIEERTGSQGRGRGGRVRTEKPKRHTDTCPNRVDRSSRVELHKRMFVCVCVCGWVGGGVRGEKGGGGEGGGDKGGGDWGGGAKGGRAKGRRIIISYIIL